MNDGVSIANIDDPSCVSVFGPCAVEVSIAVADRWVESDEEHWGLCAAST